MKLVAFDGGRIGVLDERGVVELTDLVTSSPESWPPLGMVRLVAEFERLHPEIERRRSAAEALDIEWTRFDAPITWPNKLVAFPANYQKHIEEMNSLNRANHNGFFLMANSSISGPNQPIVLPSTPGLTVHHECELGLIIGRGGRDIPVERAMEHVFGYSCLVDVTVRGKQERVARKSFDSFTPIGPWIVTADDVATPEAIGLQLSVNGKLRQQANTRDLLLNMSEMIAMTSAITTLYPGDLIATGTPEGVGPLKDGDELTISIQHVGSMTLNVVRAAPAGGYSLDRWAQPMEVK